MRAIALCLVAVVALTAVSAHNLKKLNADLKAHMKPVFNFKNSKTRRQTSSSSNSETLSPECVSYMTSAEVLFFVRDCEQYLDNSDSIFDIDDWTAASAEVACGSAVASCMNRAKNIINGKRECFDSLSIAIYNDYYPALCTMNNGVRCGLALNAIGNIIECGFTSNRTHCETTSGCSWQSAIGQCIVNGTTAQHDMWCHSCVSTARDVLITVLREAYRQVQEYSPSRYHSTFPITVITAGHRLICRKHSGSYCLITARAPLANNYLFQNDSSPMTQAVTNAFTASLCPSAAATTCYNSFMGAVFNLIILGAQDEYLTCLNSYVGSSNWWYERGLSRCSPSLLSNIRGHYERERLLNNLCLKNTEDTYCLGLIALVTSDLKSCSDVLFNGNKTCSADCNAAMQPHFESAGCCLWQIQKMVGDYRPTAAEYARFIPEHPYVRARSTSSPGTRAPMKDQNVTLNATTAAPSAAATTGAPATTTVVPTTTATPATTTAAPATPVPNTTASPPTLSPLDTAFYQTVMVAFLPCDFANNTAFKVNATTECVFPNVTVRPKLKLGLRLRYEAIITNPELVTKIKTACKSDTAAAMGVTQDKIVNDRLARNTEINLGSSSTRRRQTTNSSDDGTSYEFEIAAASDAEAEAAQASFNSQVSSGEIQVTATAQVVENDCQDCTKSTAEVESGTSAPTPPGSPPASSSGLVDSSASDTGSSSGAGAMTASVAFAAVAGLLALAF